jgi:hypothetical protein
VTICSIERSRVNFEHRLPHRRAEPQRVPSRADNEFQSALAALEFAFGIRQLQH